MTAHNGNGRGPRSEEVGGTPTSGSAVDLGTPVLSRPQWLHHGMVQLDWDDVEGAGWYVVQYYHSNRGDGAWVDLPAVEVDVAFGGSGAVVSNMDGRLSWFRVRAASCAGSSEWSQIEELFGTGASHWQDVPVPAVRPGDEPEPCPATRGAAAAPEPPAKPTGLTADTVSHNTVALTWDNPKDDTITGYMILRRDKAIHPQGTFDIIQADTGSADTTYTDDTAAPSRKYVYRIKATNTHGTSNISNWARGYTPTAP